MSGPGMAMAPPSSPPPPRVSAGGDQVAASSEDLARQCRDQQAELERSEKVRAQLRMVAEALQRKVSDLEGEVRQLRESAAASSAAAAPAVPDPSPDAEQLTLLKERLRSLEASEAEAARRFAELEQETIGLRAAAETAATSQQALSASLQAAEAARVQLGEELTNHQEQAAEREASFNTRLRSMVSADLVQRSEQEVRQLTVDNKELREECARLRGALAEFWAQGGDSGTTDSSVPGAQGANGCTNAELELLKLDNVQAELEQLASLQVASTTEVRRMQQLEKTNAALEEKLRQLTEKNAKLQSGTCDLQDEGKTMREVLVKQNESFVQRIDDLTEDRKLAQADRAKLLQECTDLLGQLEDSKQREAKLANFEGTNRRLEAERQQLAGEVERLRVTNTALCMQVLGDDACDDGDEAMQMMRGRRPMSSEGGGVAEDSMQMVLKLQKRLTEREEAHWKERQLLTDRIQELERVNSRQAVSNLSSSSKAPSPKQSAAPTPRSWVATLGSGIRSQPAAEPARPKAVPEAVVASFRSGLTAMRDMMPKP